MNGIINIYKEKGYTSFDVVARLRGIFHQKKIGHTGTLDPDAEGVLPVCLGRATKVCDLLTDKDKVYEAVLLLGVETDTQDVAGQVLKRADDGFCPDREEVLSAILSFEGDYDQIPPMYSALKVGGQKLCDLARQGVSVERRPRRIKIYSIEILKVDLPRVRMRVHCSKGTYIRTLCHDIGKKLGCGGCMESLLRTRVSDFALKDALTLSRVEELVSAGEIAPYILSVDRLFGQYRAFEVSDSEQTRKFLRNGNRIPEAWVREIPETPGGVLRQTKDAMPAEADRVRLYDSGGDFVGLYAYQDKQKDYKPIRIFMELV